jgi:NAD(P)-dependent dehydrogenase (short-subunit alcohol dehydrogenase family)
VRNPDGASNLKAAIEESDGAIAMLELDVMQESSIKDAVGQVLALEGQIDVLVNNAGIGRGTALEETPLAAAREMFETNFFGAAALTKAVLPQMRERESGTIINVSSLAGRYASPNHGYYAASKHALEALSESLAQEVRQFNIRVAIIEPGVIATAIFENSQNAAPEPGPNSPYNSHRRRLLAFFNTQLAKSGITQPDAVAEVIEHAFATDEPKLRYLVGDDAKLVWAARQRATDEQIVENGGIVDDEEFFDAMQEWLGQDLFRL